jgi:glucose-6-phosphate isomerase
MIPDCNMTGATGEKFWKDKASGWNNGFMNFNKEDARLEFNGTGASGKKFDALVVNGIGGSALGPQLLQFAVNGPYWNEKNPAARQGNLRVYFLDNTDSAGLADVLEVIDLETTLQLCVSKSGGTQETLNNLTALENIYAAAGLKYADFACAITMEGSKLDQHAKAANYLKVFPMAESIGGRTSETSIVGHVPAALAGIDFAMFLEGACRMDIWTRNRSFRDNPAMMLAAMWYIAGAGKGDRNTVIVPYSDRLLLLSRYLQQLVMESLGKELNLDGKPVNQGLNVFGNKGGTDAHAFIQQLSNVFLLRHVIVTYL